MAHGSSASRHGRYDAFRTDFSSENVADELPSQSVFSYEGTEAVRRVRENPTISRQQPAYKSGMSRGVIPSGPVVAVHMLDVASDKFDSRESPPHSSPLRRWSREALDGTDGFPPASPRPPATPRTSRPGSVRRRSRSGQRPPSSQGQRPPSARSSRPQSSQRSSQDYMVDQEEVLPPMTTLRPQSSLGKYHVLPDISSMSPTHNSLHPDPVSTTRSDTSDDHERGKEELDYLTSKLAHQALVENSRKDSKETVEWDGINSEGVNSSAAGRRRSREESSAGVAHEKRDSVTSPVSRSTPVEQRRMRRRSSTSSNAASPELSADDRSYTSLTHYKMDEAPKPSSEGQILLGIKIPTDGTRHKQYFNKRDQLRCIVLFAEEVSGEDFSNHIVVLATPRQRFDNLSQTIESAGLQSKSVVHLEELD
ncbi:UBX domain-containing protein 10-like [Littorina saxatilis]|uniref:UBX domain-containing protein n=1 Tax=Littorina saxatilis TaxID=31220 RepID=A0AAN9AW80_9CAEN